MSRPKLFAWSVCVLVILIALPLPAQESRVAPATGKDQVTLKSGDVWPGVNVESETYLQVKVTGKDPIDTTKIESIRHGDAPPDYFLAESNIRRGQYQDALKRLEKARGAKARPWLKHYCQYYKAFCLQKLAEAQGRGYEAAIKEYDALIKAQPKGIWVPQATLGIVECYYLSGGLDKAMAKLQEVAKSDFPEYWKLKAKIWEGRLKLAQGKGEEAAAILSEVTESTKKVLPEIYNEAVLYLAEALTRAKKFDEAEQLLRNLVNEAQSDKLKAAAHNALGDCFMAQNKVKEARFEFLRTVVLYFKQPEEYARALFMAAQCFELLKDANGADKLRAKLKKECPDSVWAKRLEQPAKPG